MELKEQQSAGAERYKLVLVRAVDRLPDRLPYRLPDRQLGCLLDRLLDCLLDR